VLRSTHGGVQPADLVSMGISTRRQVALIAHREVRQRQAHGPQGGPLFMCHAGPYPADKNPYCSPVPMLRAARTTKSCRLEFGFAAT
jgi:hypothetical protein